MQKYNDMLKVTLSRFMTILILYMLLWSWNYIIRVLNIRVIFF